MSRDPRFDFWFAFLHNFMKTCFFRGALFIPSTALALCVVCSAKAETSIQKTTFRGFAAYRISDQQTQAIVVPATGRVLEYGFVGSFNWLWQLPEREARDAKPYKNWRNWGGDKTWLAPQSHWPALAGRDWPPDAAWGNAKDGEHRVVSDSKGVLRIRGPVSSASGVQITRDYRFQNGELLISQSVEKKTAGLLVASIWSVTGIERPQLAWIPRRAASFYSRGFARYAGTGQAQVEAISDELLRWQPGRDASYKIGADAQISALAAWRNGQLFTQSAPFLEGEYPDGVAGAGFPVEIFDTGAAPAPFLELELLSPLRTFRRGTSWTHTVRWSLQRTDNQTLTAIEEKVARYFDSQSKNPKKT